LESSFLHLICPNDSQARNLVGDKPRLVVALGFGPTVFSSPGTGEGLE
jgi:hypothetical protein